MFIIPKFCVTMSLVGYKLSGELCEFLGGQ